MSNEDRENPDRTADLYPPREQKVVVFTPRQVISLLVAVMTVTGGGSAVATFRAFVPSGQAEPHTTVTHVTQEQLASIKTEFDTLKSDVADNHKETVDKLAETNEKLTDLNKDIKELRQYLMWGGRGRIGVPN